MSTYNLGQSNSIILRNVDKYEYNSNIKDTVYKMDGFLPGKGYEFTTTVKAFNENGGTVYQQIHDVYWVVSNIDSLEHPRDNFENYITPTFNTSNVSVHFESTDHLPSSLNDRAISFEAYIENSTTFLHNKNESKTVSTFRNNGDIVKFDNADKNVTDFIAFYSLKIDDMYIFTHKEVTNSTP